MVSVGPSSGRCSGGICSGAWADAFNASASNTQSHIPAKMHVLTSALMLLLVELKIYKEIQEISINHKRLK